jgi:hypothetical protein
MPTILFRLLLFLNTYLPIIPVFCLLYWYSNRILAYVLTGVGVILLIPTYLYFKNLVPRMSSSCQTVKEVQRHDSDMLNYIAAYLLPFLTFSLTSWNQIVALLLTLAILGYIYAVSTMIAINPTLQIFFHYHLYDVVLEGKEGDHFSLLTQRNILTSKSRIRVYDIGDGTLIEQKDEQKERKNV